MAKKKIVLTEVVMKAKGLNYLCTKKGCSCVTTTEPGMAGHLENKHSIKLTAKNRDQMWAATEKKPTSPRNTNSKKDKKKEKKIVAPLIPKGVDLNKMRNTPPSKNDVVVIISVLLEINVSRGTNRIIEDI